MAEFGIECVIQWKEKSFATLVDSAFLKTNTKTILFNFFEKDFNLNPDKLTKIKFEIDMTPFAEGEIVEKEYNFPEKFKVSVYDESSLFAGKIGAILTRRRKKRPKGRDYYDYIFYINNNIKPNFNYLKSLLIFNNLIGESVVLDNELLKKLLIDKFLITNFKLVIEDVYPFVRNKKSIESFSFDFFNKITREYNFF